MLIMSKNKKEKERLTMTILKDISDTLRDAVEIAKEMDIKLNKQTSIAKLSLSLIHI